MSKKCDCDGRTYPLTATSYILCIECGTQYPMEGKQLQENKLKEGRKMEKVDWSQYADVEALLNLDEDVFIGTADGYNPPHPQSERVLEYLMAGGGGLTDYRVCFTCSVVTDDWLLINEGYECIPCSEINRTDYENRKWGSIHPEGEEE